MQNFILNYFEKKFQPILNIIVYFVDWANQDVIMWGWLIVIICFLGIVVLIVFQVWKERNIRVEKGNSHRYITLIIKNDTEDDLFECFIQLRDIGPQNVKKRGVYNSLPGFLYWTNRGQRKERITLEAYQKYEFILGIKKEDRAYIPFYGDSANYHLLPTKKDYDSELLFKGTTRDQTQITKLFGARINYDGQEFVVKKLL